MEDCFRDEDKKSISERVLAEVEKWMERFDCLVVGPGLGRDPFLLVCFFWPLFYLEICGEHRSQLLSDMVVCLKLKAIRLYLPV